MTAPQTEKNLLIALISELKNTDDTMRRADLADKLCAILERLIVVEDATGDTSPLPLEVAE